MKIIIFYILMCSLTYSQLALNLQLRGWHDVSGYNNKNNMICLEYEQNNVSVGILYMNNSLGKDSIGILHQCIFEYDYFKVKIGVGMYTGYEEVMQDSGPLIMPHIGIGINVTEKISIEVMRTPCNTNLMLRCEI